MRKTCLILLLAFVGVVTCGKVVWAQVPVITIDPPVPAVVMTDGPDPTPDVVFNVTVEGATTINITRDDITVHTRPPNVRQPANQPAAADDILVLDGDTSNPTIILQGSGLHGDGYIWIEIDGSTCSNDQGYAKNAVSEELRVDSTRPDVRLTAAGGNPTRAQPCDPATGMLTFTVEFIDESDSVTGLDAGDILINGHPAIDAEGNWCEELNAHFPSGAACPGPGCEVSGEGKLYTVVI
ncbi:MAG: hypothetical protein ACUVT8_12135, partial [Armatimonadota bacterium]